jgi:hypothetical protein
MTYFFEHTREVFLCPVCRGEEFLENKCFISIRKRNKDSKDMRKDIICSSSSICEKCFEKIKVFIVSMGVDKK